MNKKFTSNLIKEIVYEIVGEGWMDKDTYLIVFKEMADADGDYFHVEAEYHKDENEIFYTRCYDDEVIDGNDFISPCFKKQINEYLLKQVGKLDKNSMVSKHTINVELTLGIPLDMSVNEFHDWLENDLKMSVMTSIDSKVNILKVDKK